MPEHTFQCSCKVAWPDAVRPDAAILYCPTHGAAPDLLEAAKAATAALTQNATHPADVVAAVKWLGDAIRRAS